MRRFVIALLVLALAAGGALITARDGAPAATKASLRVASKQPLVLRGVGFKPRELVRVTVKAGEETTARRVRAGSQGGFTALFAESFDDFCPGVMLVQAAGARGSNATLKVFQRYCPPVPTRP
jgi:hypothetical protein